MLLKRLLVPALVLATVAFAGCDAFEDDSDPLERLPLMPLEVGSRWHYDGVSFDEQGNVRSEWKRTHVIATTTELEDGTYFVRRLEREGGFYPSTMLYRQTDSAFVSRGTSSPPNKFYYPGLGVDTFTVRIDKDMYRRIRLVSESQSVTVPAGTFDAIVFIRETIDDENGDYVISSTLHYFVPGLGLVQEEDEYGRISLTAYEPAEPLNPDVEFAEPLHAVATGTGAFLTWETTAPVGGTVRLGRNGEDLSQTISFQQAVGKREATFSGLSPGVTYDVALALDIDRATTWSDTLSFRTPNLPSHTASDLQAYQRRILGALTGEEAIGDTTRLETRGDSTSRALAADYLLSEFRALGLTAHKHTYAYHSSTSDRIWNGVNPYAIVPATVETDEYIVVGGHYDSVPGSPGAVDNASGVAVVMGATREILSFPRRTKHVIVAFFDQEENGLIGSHMFADSLVAAGVNVHSAHLADMVGWDSDGDRAVELHAPSPLLAFLYQHASLESTGIDLGPVERDGKSDHRSFIYRGIDALTVSEEYRNGDSTPHWHQPTDTFDTVNFDYLTETTRLVTHAWRLLLSQEPAAPID